MIQSSGKTFRITGAHTIITGRSTIYGKKSFCYELSAIYARAHAEGFSSPDGIDKIKLHDFIQQEKKNGVFSKTDLFFLFSYNNTAFADFSRINLKKPEGNLAVANGGLSYTTKGWKGNSTDAYIGTGFNPVTGINNYSLNNACRGSIVYTASGGVLDGISGVSTNRILLNNSTSHRINSSASLSSSVNMTGTGLKLIARQNSTESYLINKDVISVVSHPSGLVASGEQLILKSSSNYGNSCVASYIMGAAVTYNQVQAYRLNFNNLLVRLGLAAIA